MVAARCQEQLQRGGRGGLQRDAANRHQRGKPAVVVLSVAQYERLARNRAEPQPSFVEHLLAMPKDDGVFERAKIKLRDVKF